MIDFLNYKSPDSYYEKKEPLYHVVKQLLLVV